MTSTRRAPLLPANTGNRRFTILCIEDDPAIARIYERRLTAGGAQVLLSASGREGFQTAVAAGPDLILLDNGLPDEEGTDLVKRLREHAATAAIPLLMLTGSHTPGLERRLAVQGIVGVLKKPIDFDELFDHIERIASASSAGGPLASDASARNPTR